MWLVKFNTQTIKDLRLLNSWRPVSLLATDNKILAKALSIKLQKVISTLVNPNQIGYLTGWNIHENIRPIEDIISYIRLHKISGFITLVDFQKAFDTVEWSFYLQS